MEYFGIIPPGPGGGRQDDHRTQCKGQHSEWAKPSGDGILDSPMKAKPIKSGKIVRVILASG